MTPFTPRERRPRLVVGNWKMHLTAREGRNLAGALAARAAAEPLCALGLAPPFTALAAVHAALARAPIALGAQNLHAEPRGAFTGEIAGAMLADLGCAFVLVGHSERRHGMGEDDETVARKTRAAWRDGLSPLVCVGETLAEREADTTVMVLKRQISTVFAGLESSAARAAIIAYEPVWAIGTGRVATPAQVRAAHQVIRAAVDAAAGAGVGGSMTLLYGGSVNPANAASLFAEEEIDGALVGGASLEIDSFWAIAEAARGL